MSDEDIRRALQALHSELENADPIDPELVSLLREVDSDIHRALEASTPGLEGLGDRLEWLAAKLAVSHPRVEGFLRELVDALGKLGI
jgi:hypothetical protein